MMIPNLNRSLLEGRHSELIRRRQGIISAQVEPRGRRGATCLRPHSKAKARAWPRATLGVLVSVLGGGCGLCGGWSLPPFPPPGFSLGPSQLPFSSPCPVLCLRPLSVAHAPHCESRGTWGNSLKAWRGSWFDTSSLEPWSDCVNVSVCECACAARAHVACVWYMHTC